MSQFGPNARICSFLRLKIARLSHVGIFLKAKPKNTIHSRLKAKVSLFIFPPNITVTKNPNFPLEFWEKAYEEGIVYLMLNRAPFFFCFRANQTLNTTRSIARKLTNPIVMTTPLFMPPPLLDIVIAIIFRAGVVNLAVGFSGDNC